MAVEAPAHCVGDHDQGDPAVSAEALDLVVIDGARGGQDHTDSCIDENLWSVREGEEAVGTGD